MKNLFKRGGGKKKKPANEAAPSPPRRPPVQQQQAPPPPPPPPPPAQPSPERKVVTTTVHVPPPHLATVPSPVTDLTRNLVKKFIADIWNRGEVDLIPEVCSPSLRFNGYVNTVLFESAVAVL